MGVDSRGSQSGGVIELENGDSVVTYTVDDFTESTEIFDMLARIESDIKREAEASKLKKVARGFGISAKVFDGCLSEARIRAASLNQNSVVQTTAFTGQERPLACPGYICDDSGILLTGGGPYGPRRICYHPLMPTRQLVNYDTGEQKIEVSYRIGKEWNKIIVPRSTLAMATRIVKPLSEYGIAVDSENAKDIVTYFTRLLSANNDLPKGHSASRMGWIDDKHFLPYEDGLFFDGTANYRQIYEAIHEQGDSGVWFDLIRKVREYRGCVSARVALAASFASALIKPLKATPFFVHIWSDQSETGKTVAMLVGASVWAFPRLDGGYVQIMDSTDAGMKAAAGFLYSMPLCLDELCMKDGKGYQGNLDNMIYNFCDGTSGPRGTREGGLRYQKKWNCCVISTGEAPIIKSFSRAGSVNRVLEIDQDEKIFENDTFGSAAQVMETISDNYGFAGKIFIEALQKDGAIEQVRGWFKEYKAVLKSKSKATDKQIMNAAVVLTADRFAAENVFHDTNNLRVEDMIRIMKSIGAVDTNRRAHDWLMGEVFENRYMFEKKTEAGIESVDENFKGKAWGAFDVVNSLVCINTNRFERIMSEAGFDPDSYKKWAAREDLIVLDSKGKNTVPVYIKDIKSVMRCVCVRLPNEVKEDSAPDDYQKVEPPDLPF